MAIFKIHPAIGMARLGNSQSDFYLAPEQPGALPVECDSQGRAIIEGGQEKPVQKFKDQQGRIKRQAARFRVFAYEDGQDSQGRELKVGDTFTFQYETRTAGRQPVQGTVTGIEWTAHLANKKASWYRFRETDGEHGYPPSHPLRNAGVTDPAQRRRLIIDPGPQTVAYQPPEARRKEFARGKNPGYPQNFPSPDIAPRPIDTLGELIVNQQDSHIRLILLGGYGNSGSDRTPIITQYANNEGWFDDVSDGPVTAKIQYEFVQEFTDKDGKPQKRTLRSTADVDVPAWAVVGYPRYVPQLVDMITMDDVIYDLSLRRFAYDPQIYGVAPFDQAANNPQTDQEWDLWRNDAEWNPGYYPKFYREIWPILKRPDTFKWVYDFDPFAGGDPHNTGTGGNLDKKALSMPPMQGQDPNLLQRRFIYSILRKRGQENLFRTPPLAPPKGDKPPNYRPRAMPELCGDNPLSNTAAQKFLRLTDTQLFLLKQWAEGKFVNECLEWGEKDPGCEDPYSEPPVTGTAIDRGVLSNVLGGAFCPGGELTWIMLNPAIYSRAYRISQAQYQAGALSLPKAAGGSPSADLADGLEPGDLTKYLALPWQADFTQCTEQSIDISYERWNNIYPGSTGDPAQQEFANNVPWWPVHRPIVVFFLPPAAKSPVQVYWGSGIPENDAGGLRMATAWSELGFIKKNKRNYYLMVERNDAALGPPVKPGDLLLGNTKRSEKDE